jgi:transcriptional regulator with XRE-family HTH domain
MVHPTPTSSHTASRLRDRRLAAGLKQAELAERAGCRQSTISQIESGARRGGVNLLNALAGALGCTVDDLINGTG